MSNENIRCANAYAALRTLERISTTNPFIIEDSFIKFNNNFISNESINEALKKFVTDKNIELKFTESTSSAITYKQFIEHLFDTKNSSEFKNSVVSKIISTLHKDNEIKVVNNLVYIPVETDVKLIESIDSFLISTYEEVNSFYNKCRREELHKL